MTLMEDIHNIDHEYDLNNKAFQTSDHVSEPNKQAVARFIDKCAAEGLSKSRRRKYVSNFHTILKLAPDDFSLLDADKEDLERVVRRIEDSDEHASWTRVDFRIALKKFYRVMEGNGEEYPDKVKFIKTTRDKSDKELPDPLEREQVDAIIGTCQNDRDRAMYKVLYEAGCRPGELMALRVKDVKFVDNGVRLNIRGKTGNRQILVVESERYLRNWLSKHPFQERRDSPLWVKIRSGAIEDKTPEDIRLSYDYMLKNLKRKAVKADIRTYTNENGNRDTEIVPYTFRHSRATHLATKMTEAAMCAFFGWVQGSDMPQVYIHLSGKDIDKEIMRIYGIEPEEDQPQKRECPRCYKTYKGHEQYCPRCGAPLTDDFAKVAEDTGDSLDRINGRMLRGLKTEEDVLQLADMLRDALEG